MARFVQAFSGVVILPGLKFFSYNVLKYSRKGKTILLNNL